jgi:hypothetical protein
MRPEVAREALGATHGGLRLAWCAVLGPLSPRVLSRLVCALGPQRLVAVRSRGERPWPVELRAAAQPRRCRPARGSLPTIVSGRVLWHLGYTAAARAVALPPSSGLWHRAAAPPEPTYQVRGLLTAGGDSTPKSLRPLLPGARLGTGLRHALSTLPKHLAALPSPVRKAVRSPFHPVLSRARQRQRVRGVALGQP